MVYNIIPLLIIIASLTVILYIIGRKFPELRILDVTTIREEKESIVKKNILEIRWQRAIDGMKKGVVSLLKRFFGNVFRSISGLYKRVLELEKFYKEQNKEKKYEKVETHARIENYLLEAKKLQEEGSLKEAEELYIKALEVDEKNISAYRGLGEVYGAAKDYQKAKETLQFLIQLLASQRLEPDSDAKNMIAKTYSELAFIDEHLGNYHESLSHIRKALSMDSHNPKFLDLLLHFSIIVKDKKLARDTLKKLKTTNPENQKLEEFEEKIERI